MFFEELEAILLAKTSSRYQRSNYDKFLNELSFNFVIPSIHVTGSNGKGSTCTFLSLIYQEAGYKVGLFTSPFFYHPTEMIKINGTPISKEDFLSLYIEFKNQFDKYNLSAFEIETFIGLTYFKRNNCNFCVIEAGMGGIIDATNCFNPVLSVITSICLEHTQYLGTTYSEIAANKGGIIKKGVPVLVGKLEESAENTLREISKNNGSNFYISDQYYFLKQIDDRHFIFDYRPYEKIIIPVNITSQIKDACLAIEACKILNNAFPTNEENIRNGISKFKLICRGEWFNNIFIDGGHNIEAIELLTDDFKFISHGKKVHILYAGFKDKNIASILPVLSLNAASVNLTTFNHPRARTEEDYFLYLDDFPFINNWKDAITKIVNENKEDILLVTGSLAFVGFVREFLDGKQCS